MSYRFALGWTLAALIVVSSVRGQAPMGSSGPLPVVELAADINTLAVVRGSSSGSWIGAGDYLYFIRFLASFESELWRTDGSPGGTQMVREVGSLSPSSGLHGGELPDGRLIFSAYDRALGHEIWTSDGTPGGTRLLADICPGACDSRLILPGTEGFMRLGDELVFSAEPVAFGSQRLFATTGDASGLRSVSELDVVQWTVAAGRIYMVGGAPDYVLWVSDGEAASEHMVPMPPLTRRPMLRAFGSRVLLVADNDSGGDLVLSGDASGVVQIADSGFSSIQATAVGQDLAYLASSARLWRTDGTAEGTFELTAVSVDGGRVGEMHVVDERLFFFVDDRYLWTSDGSGAGTMRIADFGRRPLFGLQPGRLTTLGSRACFFADNDMPALWCSDGSAAGTVRVRSFDAVDSPGGLGVPPLGVLDSRLFFAAEAGGTGLELWISDGSTEGTELVANLTGDAGSSSPRGFVRRSQDVAFSAHQGDPAAALFRRSESGAVELGYVSDRRSTSVLSQLEERVILDEWDNSRDGPTRVLSIDPADGSVVELVQVRRVWGTELAGDRLYLETGVAVGSGFHPVVSELWSTEGTPEGTVRLVPGADGLRTTEGSFYASAVGSRLFFTAESNGHGNEVWMTDGTPEGTQQVADLNPGADSSHPRFLAVANERLYVRATTPDGVSLVGFDRQGATLGALALPTGATGELFTTVGDRLLWSYGTAFGEPEELWVSDADFSNRTLLGIFPNLWRLTAAGEGAIFECLKGSNEFELWVTDGTAAGTVLRENVSRVGAVVSGEGRVFFPAATVAHGEELWVSDGTVGGTRLVADIEPGPESSAPLSLVAVDGGLVFSARTAAEGREPWSSDGETDGTRLLGDIVIGPRGSHPEGFTAADNTILFSAYRDDVGRELFSVPRSTLVRTCTPSQTRLCLNQGRFEVEVVWRDFAGGTGPGRPVPISVEDSGLFYFFDPDNWEILVKVLDGCAINDRYWVFAAATTDVEYTLTVTDTINGEHVQYFNTLGTASPAITDTEAFATCP